MEQPQLDDAWLERLACKLAAAFRPYFEVSKREEWERSLAQFLGVETLPAPEVMKWGALDCDGAIHALTRWLGLNGDAPEADVSVVVAGTVGVRGQAHAAAFRRIETRPEESEAAIASATLLLDRGGRRWAIVVEYDDYPPCDVEVSLYAATANAAERQALVAEVTTAVRLHRLGRGGMLVYRQTGPRLLRRPDLTWDDVILSPGLREEVRRNVELPLAAAMGIGDRRLPRRRSVLLSGPPGTGKTLVGKALAATLPDVSFLWITPGGLGQCNDLAILFEWARQRTPAIVFFEDLDLAIGERCAGGNAMLGEILAQLDGFASNDGVVVVATTNEPRVIDEALRRPGRFDRHLVIGLPGETERRAMLERFLGDSALRADGAILAELTRTTENLTGSHLKELVHTARLACAARDGEDLEAADFDEALTELRLVRRPIGFTAGEEPPLAGERAA